MTTRYREFIERNPEFSSIPEFIVGENGNQIAINGRDLQRPHALHGRAQAPRRLR